MGPMLRVKKGTFLDSENGVFSFAWSWALWGAGVSGTQNPKNPTVQKTLRDSELLRRSVFTTPSKFTTPWTLLSEEQCLQERVDHNAIVNSLRVVNWLSRSLFRSGGGLWSTSFLFPCFIVRNAPGMVEGYDLPGGGLWSTYPKKPADKRKKGRSQPSTIPS